MDAMTLLPPDLQASDCPRKSLTGLLIDSPLSIASRRLHPLKIGSVRSLCREECGVAHTQQTSLDGQGSNLARISRSLTGQRLDQSQSSSRLDAD